MNSAVVIVLFALLASSQAIDWAARANLKIHCGVSAWSAWKCVGSTCGRTREIIRQPQNGGQACPDLYETKASNSQDDPWDGKNVVQKVQSKYIAGHRRTVSFAKTATQAGGTTVLSRDLLFIVDMSGSITKPVFEKTKQKMGELIELICGTIGKTRQHNRISVVVFSTQVELKFDFKTHFDIHSVKKAINAIPYRGGLTCTGDALSFAHTVMFDPTSGIRDATESTKDVLVLTDGQSNCGKNIAVEVKRLQVKAFVYALAIGKFTPQGRKEIESMVTRPLIDHIFSLHNFQKFFNMVDELAKYLNSNPSNVCIPFELSR